MRNCAIEVEKPAQRPYIEEEMSAEDPAATTSPGETPAAGAPDPGRGCRGTGARAEEAATEEISGDLVALDFGVHKSIRYHAKRRAFFDVAHRFAMLVAVVGGSGAFFALIGDKTAVGQVAALLVAVATALDLVFALSENAREHDKLAERFSDLAVELARAERAGVGVRQIAELTAKRLTLEKSEPTALDALNVICHNEEAESRGYGRDHLYRVGWGQKIFAQLITFPWFSPTPQAG